jgi:hypothetical protein
VENHFGSPYIGISPAKFNAATARAPWRTPITPA